MYLMQDVLDACGDDPNPMCRVVYENTDSTAAAALVDWFVDRPLRIVIIVFTALVVARLARRAVARFTEQLVKQRSSGPQGRATQAIRKLSKQRSNEERVQQQRSRQRAVTLGAVLRSLVTVVIWSVAVLLVLAEVNVSLAPLIASAGIAGVAIGFGAQSLVRDFLAGVFFVIEDQFGVGDIIDVGDAVGTVEEVTLRTTRIRDAAGILWIVPNGEIRRIGNASQLWSNSLLDIDVAYNTDIDYATEVIQAVLDEIWHEQDPDALIIGEPQVLGVESLGADAVSIRATVKTEPAAQYRVARVIRGRLKKAFDDAGIEMPFPQRTVWIRDANDDVDEEASGQPTSTEPN